MALKVTVKEAGKLPNVELLGKSDPYTAVAFRGKTLKTKHIDNCLDPQWNETLEFPLKQLPLTASDLLDVQVFDYELIGHDRLLGETQVSLRRVARMGDIESNFPLTAIDGSTTEATISLGLSYKAPATDSADSQQDRQDDGIPSLGGAPSATPTTGSSGSTTSRASSLPDRPLHFHLRLHIIEAHGLLGENLNPTVKVIVGEETQRTQVAKGTMNPSWNETLVFSGRETPQDFLSRVVDLRVYNSRMIRTNTLIGSFKCDVGLVYDEPGHAIIHKWLLLTDPEDVTSEAKGYLKVSVNVLPPGAVAKHSPMTMDGDTTDIENNLWKPVRGAGRQSATLSVCVFRAEDIPQMDPTAVLGPRNLLSHDSESQKEKLADPYLTVSVCGRTCKTDIVQKNRNPVWNEQLNLPLKFPALCDRVKLQLLDDDGVGHDDYIGTVCVSLSQISVPVKRGLLPTFGPVFVNMYGSPREFSTLPTASLDDMNKGKREGVAYRGRVLVSMETTLGVLPTVPKESVNPKQLKTIQLYLQRKAYMVYAVFLHAGMISPVGQPVQFEVSIGNYGNMLDQYVPGSISRTPPTKPVYDGNHYHYLPWFDSKPCVQVESHWEDNTCRIESLNIMLSMCRQLEAGLSRCKALMAMRTYSVEDLKGTAAEMLGNLITHLEMPLPTPLTEELLGQNVNNLDMALHVWRKQELGSILKDAQRLQSTDTSPFQALEEVEGLYQRLTKLATEPQISVPDVVISMISGGTHVAFSRIPAHRLMYQPKQGPADSSLTGQGDLFGRPQTVILKPPCGVQEMTLEGGQEGCAQVEVVLGLGLASQLQNSPHWSEFLHIPGGQAVVFAETYENEAYLASWGTKGLSKPNFSDIKGQVSLPKDSFSPPVGWRWEGSWYIGNSPSSLATSHTSTAEQGTRFVVFEYQTRSNDSNAGQASSKTEWKDEHGNKLPIQVKEDLKPRDGMEWASDWVTAMEGAVDEDGWQYTSPGAGSTWMATAQKQHQYKRRKWTRLSTKKANQGGIREPLTTLDELTRNLSSNEGWEYACFPFVEYHPTNHLLDLVRRRRLLRRMVEDTSSGAPRKYSAPPVFHISTEKTIDSKDSTSQDWAPLMLISFPKSARHTYQMRVYLYKARDLYSSDNSGLSTPYGIASFIHKSGTSTVKEQTVNPVWSQTVVLDTVNLYGPPEHADTFLPPVRIEFFDKDVLGQDEYLGVSVVPASVCLDGRTGARPQLLWHPIERWGEYGGETLVAAILFLKDDGMELPDVVFPEPAMESIAIEMLCLGVRDVQVSPLHSINSPLVELECGGQRKQMDTPITSVRHFPNFPDPLLKMNMKLPVELLYAPSLNIRLLDRRMFGWKPLVGVHSIQDISTVRHGSQSGLKELTSIARVLEFLMKKANSAHSSRPNRTVEGGGGDGEMAAVEMQADVVSLPEARKYKDDDFDWWNKFHASDHDSSLRQEEYEQLGYDRLVVYPWPLEDQFDHFQDLVAIYPLFHGKGRQDRKENIVGKLKAALRIHPIAEDEEVGKESNLFAKLALAESVDCLVRVYIVKAIDLQPADWNGKADPYICVKLGSREFRDKKNYIPNELNPVFGKVYELPAHLPTDHTLKVIVMDYDRISDDLIGETTIDLENRYFTQHGARCGLPETFSVGGVNEWRDAQLPVDLLADWSEMHGFEQPRWNGATELVVGGTLYRLVDFVKLATLSFLHCLTLWNLASEPGGPPHMDVGPEDQRLALHVLRWQGLVPEHVETRPLYHPKQDTVQGQVQMWVDIFPNYLGPPPPPVDITPWQPKKYELRVIIYNTQDVRLEDTSVVTGEDMSDIYIKGWLQGQDETQKTDVHYRSLDGEGNFNWRMVFPFEYLPQEKMMVVRKKKHFFSLDKTERKLRPQLSLQIWDNDPFSPDDILGSLEVDLLSVPQHAKSAHGCSFGQLPEAKTASLFKKHRMRGWWPMLRQGKIEMEMEILTEQEAKARPAGRGRSEPNKHPFLPDPSRPATSFLWLTSPWKSYKFIVWKYYKWHFIGAIALFLTLLLVAVWIYTIPSTFSNWLTSNILQ